MVVIVFLFMVPIPHWPLANTADTEQNTNLPLAMWHLEVTLCRTVLYLGVSVLHALPTPVGKDEN